MSERAPRLARLVLSAWAGGLWTVCGVVVPGVFWLLDDRRLAGNIATQFFYAEVALGSLFAVSYWALRRPLEASLWRWWWLAFAAPLVFFVLLRPLMSAARAAGEMARFGQLHGLASLLFLCACLSVGVLLWRDR